MTSRRPRLLVRVFLYGIAMLALASGASFLVGTYAPRPGSEVPTRPSTAWIAWHMLDRASDPVALRDELDELSRRSRISISLFEADGRLIASNSNPPPNPLPPSGVARLAEQPTRFDEGVGEVATLDPSGKVVRYARMRYPVTEAPVGVAVAQLGVILGILGLLSLALARSVTGPVERLLGLTQAFGAGDLSVRAKSARNDELGDLARAFDEMADRITALRRSEKELLANVSHELRTPLARIRLALELVRSGDASRAEGYFGDIDEDLSELESLLNDIMTTARLDIARGAGGEALPPLRLEPLQGRAVIDAARSRFAARHPERTLGGTVESDLPAVTADPVLLRRVLDNLLDNAVKFSEPTEAVELEGSRGSEPESLVIRVRDRGAGIPHEDVGRVFEPFFRGDRSRTRSTGGVGLGLAVARRIVEAHSGTISVESSADTGTCFRVVVPARREQPNAE
ncbi:MAG TPA: HAMP domain-containing sensor histidine kinase [Polyangiaceae bacterium]